jgi:uncharacterized membrane protein YkgB
VHDIVGVVFRCTLELEFIPQVITELSAVQLTKWIRIPILLAICIFIVGIVLTILSIVGIIATLSFCLVTPTTFSFPLAFP